LSLNLVTTGPKFQHLNNTKAVGFVDIFPMALVSLNSVQGIRSNRQISTAARLG